MTVGKYDQLQTSDAIELLERGNPSIKIASTTETVKGVFLEDGLQFSEEILKASEVTWEDKFFDDDDDVIAVFDYDYDTVINFLRKVGFLGFLCLPYLALSLIFLEPCTYWQHIGWEVRAQHLAVTRDGIRVVTDKRRTWFGFKCTEAPRSTVTVTYDMIIDCDVIEPAGSQCCCIKEVYTKTFVDTASRDKDNVQNGYLSRPLLFQGLKKPYEFKKLVWAMKRWGDPIRARAHNERIEANLVEAASLIIPSAEAMDDRGDVPTLLREIRDGMRVQKTLLK